MRTLSLILFLSISHLTNAHPGTGLVIDSKGNIFYTDLEHVWKISPEGVKSIAVKNVHTHHLYMDANDNLFGQHSIYSGEATNKWYHYLWKLNSIGSLDTIRPVTEGFYIENFSFTRDDSNNMYWVKIGDRDKIIMTSQHGVNTEIISGDFKNVQWMHYTNDRLYFVQEVDIFSLTSNGILHKIASDLTGKEKAHNSLFGLWSDKQNNIYVANSDYQKIQKIDSAGVITDIYTSQEEWFPTSGLFDNENNLWVMEVNSKNEVRVVRADKHLNKSKSLQQPFANNATILIIAVCSLLIILSIVITKRKKLPVTEN